MRNDQRGDTIVEVLIAAAIISLVLVASFAISNKSSLSIQNNQERIQAQHLAAAQLEALRANGSVSSNGCFNGTTPSATCNNFTMPGSGATYDARIVGPDANNNYVVTVQWTSIGGQSNNDSKLEYVYRLQ